MLYTMKDQDGGLEAAILQAAFKTQTQNLIKTFEYAMQSQRIEFARKALQERPKDGRTTVR